MTRWAPCCVRGCDTLVARPDVLCSACSERLYALLNTAKREMGDERPEED